MTSLWSLLLVLERDDDRLETEPCDHCDIDIRSASNTTTVRAGKGNYKEGA